ncbi:MAG: thioredoxin family protein [Gammaproteobacteria bacterium]|nr:thioredoxin family protein [Gammaproteobacteria bacterium]
MIVIPSVVECVDGIFHEVIQAVLLEAHEVKTGWQAMPFELPDPDGKSHSLNDLLGEKGLLVAFICNHCPYVIAVADRLAADAKLLQSEGINVVAINPNDFENYPDDSPANMKRFAAKHGFDFPYLVDEDQTVAKAYDAVCTPDFFGLNADGILQYRGRLDDARMKSGEGRTPELLDAMRMVASTGTGPSVQHPSMGCSIKWRPARR